MRLREDGVMTDYMIESVVEELKKRDDKIIKLTQALSLIKEKEVNIKYFLNTKDVSEYNSEYEKLLTKEQYLKIKEVLLEI